jgi:hypothetical protein
MKDKAQRANETGGGGGVVGGQKYLISWASFLRGVVHSNRGVFPVRSKTERCETTGTNWGDDKDDNHICDT